MNTKYGNVRRSKISDIDLKNDCQQRNSFGQDQNICVRLQGDWENLLKILLSFCIIWQFVCNTHTAANLLLVSLPPTISRVTLDFLSLLAHIPPTSSQLCRTISFWVWLKLLGGVSAAKGENSLCLPRGSVISICCLSQRPKWVCFSLTGEALRFKKRGSTSLIQRPALLFGLFFLDLFSRASPPRFAMWI